MKIRYMIIGAFVGVLTTTLTYFLVYVFWRSQISDSFIFHVSSRAYLTFVKSGIISIPYYNYFLFGLIVGSGIGLLISLRIKISRGVFFGFLIDIVFLCVLTLIFPFSFGGFNDGVPYGLIMSIPGLIIGGLIGVIIGKRISKTEKDVFIASLCSGFIGALISWFAIALYVY